jgi:NAD(P)-dependent dehydrogenase (short-subunit alcohol dehydrogenase family)
MEISEENWDRTMEVNLKGMFLVGQRVAQVMLEQGGGTIVNTASTNGLFAEPRLTDYSVSKAGVILLTRSMALELAPQGIRVNAVSPGFIRTPMTERGGEARFVEYAKKIPMARVGRADEIAAVFAFLASDDASYITGECVVADGGHTIYE